LVETAQLFLGVDGGGTSCRARLVDASGRLLGRGVGSGANIRLGLATSWAAILDATDQALAEAGLDRSVLPRVRSGLGLAGITSPADLGRIRAAAPAFAGIAIDTDAHAACLGAFGGGDGAILILGTGSCGYMISGGVGRSIGGWGFTLSDLGSGADIGRAAVRAAVLAYDGLGPATAFTSAVLARLGGAPPAAIAWSDAARPADYAELAPEALRCAGSGDTVAGTIVAQAAADAATHIRRLGELGATRVCLLGGLATALEPWLPPWARARLVPPQGDAVDGAVLMARDGGELTWRANS
jgi:glucosamine kinase